MVEVLVTTDPVRLSWAMAVLTDMGIEARVFDYHISLAEGSIGAFPRRLMVLDEDAGRARWALTRAAEELEAAADVEDGDASDDV